MPEFSSVSDEADFWDSVSLEEVDGIRLLSAEETDELFENMTGIIFTPESLKRMTRNGVTMDEVVGLVDNATKTSKKNTP